MRQIAIILALVLALSFAGTYHVQPVASQNIAAQVISPSVAVQLPSIGNSQITLEKVGGYTLERDISVYSGISGPVAYWDTLEFPERPVLELDNDIYLYNIIITPGEAYVFPGGKVRLTSNIAGVTWSARHGSIEDKGTYAIYTAPTYLNGAASLEDTVMVRKGPSVGFSRIIVEAGEASQLSIIIPSSLPTGSEELLKVLVLDSNSNPVQGEKVAISLSCAHGVPSAQLKSGGDDGLIIKSVSDDSGAVSVVFISGQKEETYEITARLGKISASREVAVLAAPGNGTDGSDDAVDDGSGSDAGNGSRGGTSGGGYGSGSSGSTGSANYVVEVIRNNATQEADANEPEKEAVQASSGSDDAVADTVRVAYPKSARAGDTVHITLKDASGAPMSGLVIVYEDPKGSAGTLTTGPDGSVSMRVDLEGDYMFSIEGTESKFRISVSKGASALQGKGSDDSSFDIASALFGGDSASFSFVAVLVLVLILIVGVGFYFLTQNEGDSI